MRPCTVCSHTDRKLIEEAVLKGEPLRLIAERWGLSKTAVWRHKEHISVNLVSAAEASKNASRDALKAAVNTLISDLRSVLRRAKRKRDDRAVLQTIREISKQLELIGKLDGESQEQARRELHFHMPAETALRVAQTYLLRHGAATLPATSEAKSTEEGQLSQ